MPQIKIYTKRTCPYCIRVKALFKAKGVTFEEIDVVSNANEFETIKSQTGSVTVPQVFIDGRFIGGCDDTYALDDRGGLDPLLKGA